MTHRASRTNSPTAHTTDRKNAPRKSVFGLTTAMVIDDTNNYIMDDCLPMNLIRRWPEYNIIENDDVVVTIEHCCKCWQHRDTTHHDEQKYVQVSFIILNSKAVYYHSKKIT